MSTESSDFSGEEGLLPTAAAKTGRLVALSTKL